MSKAIYCDHCEKLFSEEHVKVAEITIYNNEVMKLDLCSDCHDQLESWVYAKFDVVIPEDIEEDINNITKEMIKNG